MNGPQQAVKLGGMAVVMSIAGQPTVTYTKPSSIGFIAHGEVKQYGGGLKTEVMFADSRHVLPPEVAEESRRSSVRLSS